jgi:hypothetical protein
MDAESPIPVSYDGRRFRAVADGTDGGDASSAVYRQDGDLLWAEFSGGGVRRGMLVGTCGPDGVLDFGYSMVTGTGEVICGRCHSLPERMPDGRIRLAEHWERFGPHAGTGVSYLEEADPVS